MSEAVDLAIVGAGFAGLAAARAAAARGLKTVVLEAKPEIGARLHTTGIFTKEALEVLPLPDDLALRVEGVRLIGPSRKSVDLFAPDYYFATTDTAGVLKWMAREAEAAGADIRAGAKLTGGGRDRDGVVLQTTQASYRARWVIGADGAHSRAARVFGLGRNKRFLVGLEREYARADNLDPRFLHCFLDSGLAPGYIAWAAPAPGFIQVGLAVSHGRKPDIERFVAVALERFGIDAADETERRAGVIPCGGMVRPWAGDRVTLIGDAAGMVSPMTGGGIHAALEVGRRAGLAAAACLRDGAPEPQVALKPHVPRFGLKIAMRRALDIAPANPLFDLALSTPLFRSFAKRVYFHKGGADPRERESAPPPAAEPGAAE